MSKSIKRAGLIMMACICLVSVLAPFSSKAAPQPGDSVGYFWNEIDGGGGANGGFVLADRLESNRVSLGGDTPQRRLEFVDYIGNCFYRTGNCSPSDQNQVGAQFIVQLVRGNNGDFDRTIPTDAHYQDFRYRVLNYPGQIDFDRQAYTYSRNSRFQNQDDVNRPDDAFYRGQGTNSPQGYIVFTYNGRDKFVLKRNCANPVGEPSGLSFIPPANYGLTPFTTTDETSTTIEPGQTGTITFIHQVTNNGTTQTNDTRWDVKEFVAPPNVAVNTTPPFIDAGPGANNCNNVFTGRNICSGPEAIRDIASGSPARYPVGTHNLNQNEVSVGNYPVGTKICQFVAVDPADSGSARNRWGRPLCFTVAKSPYVAIKNGDAWAGGSFFELNAACPATTSGFSGRSRAYVEGTYGSYAEYGVFALGDVSSFGSAGKASPSNTLTFKRTGGRFFTSTNPSVANKTTHCLPDARNSFAIPTTADLPLSFINVANLTGVHRVNGDVTLRDSGDDDMSFSLAGSRPVLFVNGNVIIEDNITFSDQPSLSSLQGFTLIATGDISVLGKVNRLDGYYQTYRTFNTCREAPIGPTVNIAACSNPLAINGALSVGTLALKRVAGNNDGGSRNQPAETITMRPDVFLSQYGGASGTGQLKAINETELPPRY